MMRYEIREGTCFQRPQQKEGCVTIHHCRNKNLLQTTKNKLFFKTKCLFLPCFSERKANRLRHNFFLKKVLFVIVFKWYLPPYAITRNTNTLARKLCLFPSLVALSEFISRKAEQRPTDMLTKHNSPVYPSEYRCPIRLTD